MSDPIFQSRSLSEAALRISGAFVLAPLLGVVALVTFYHVHQHMGQGLADFNLAQMSSIWTGSMMLLFIALVPSVLISILLAAYSKSAKPKTLGVIVIMLLIGAFLASLYHDLGGNYFTILGASFVLLAMGFEAMRLCLAIIKPHLTPPYFSRNSQSV